MATAPPTGDRIDHTFLERTLSTWSTILYEAYILSIHTTDSTESNCEVLRIRKQSLEPPLQEGQIKMLFRSIFRAHCPPPPLKALTAPLAVD